ncbi:MAG: transcription antitermination factor NusB [Bacteriovoracaceae bacterium]|mgnify:CR=1 FL=1|nr:transcription antitermination factor NusB [Deltaproteobacteria bacterium]MDI9543385.1 transcription antitermination factor NusB [Pseudomonadota bacterium]NLW68416.1 transcription antitermination factor NusB [Bacteriovoracaceae bacterium]HRR21255.1 transcription antitermination factor NusB [Desulfomonilia bacterium]HNR51092.1 transcription antitermination factor NusB [Deltaproteobacteria bacterium]
MRIRTKAREIALQYLYQVDITKNHTDETLKDFIDHFVEDRDVVPYAHDLIEGVYNHLHKIDELIENASNNWSVSRMSTTDRNILRIATYELAFKPDIPYKVAINEGIELAKKFGSPRFPAFANGVLDRVRTEVFSDENTD